VLATLIYVNFFTHHYVVDLRYGILALTVLIYGRTIVHFTIDRVPRQMPLLLGFFLVSLFIWFVLGRLALSASAQRMVAGDTRQARLLVPADDHQLRAGGIGARAAPARKGPRSFLTLGHSDA
jgi:cobalamin biosynthesis protein CobD/CbiB